MRRAEDRLLRGRLEHDLRSQIPLGEDDVVRISEISCGIPGCPDLETVFLLMRPGRRTEIAKVPVPMACLGARDLDEVARRFGGLPANVLRTKP